MFIKLLLLLVLFDLPELLLGPGGSPGLKLGSVTLPNEPALLLAAATGKSEQFERYESSSPIKSSADIFSVLRATVTYCLAIERVTQEVSNFAQKRSRHRNNQQNSCFIATC